MTLAIKVVRKKKKLPEEYEDQVPTKCPHSLNAHCSIPLACSVLRNFRRRLYAHLSLRLIRRGLGVYNNHWLSSVTIS